MNISLVENWLQEHTGLDASTLGAGVVAGAVRARIAAAQCASAEEYLSLLALSVEERQMLIERVVVPETWFFRDRPALDALARHVVETWGRAHPGEKFRVLSVPCSTGEEAYSLTIALALAGWPLEHVEIDAIDISRRNLARAQSGIYGRNSFRGDDLSFRSAFFEPVGADEWKIAERLRDAVRFEHGNLLAPDFASGRRPYDAVFCRNLLIYFDRPTQARAIRVLDRLLSPAGWFAVGPAEPVLLFEHGYEMLRVPSAFLLRRATVRLTLPPRRVPLLLPPPPTPRPLPPLRLEARPEPAAPPPSLPVEAELAELRQLADTGRVADASVKGEALLARGVRSAELFFLLAVVAAAGGDTARAQTLFRKVLYLEPQHTEALAHLALLAEQLGDARNASAYRARAQRALQKEAR